MSVTNTIIIVPGARYPKSSSAFIQGMIVRVFGFFNVIPQYSDDEEGWIRPLREQGYEIIRFRWSGDVSPSSVRRAVDDLTTLIHDTRNVSIISCSLGTRIALTASSRSPNDVELLIPFCGVYRHDGSAPPIIDVRSPNDVFGNIFHTFLNMFVRKPATTRRLSFDGIRHDEFADDIRIPSGFFTGRRISEVTSALIRDWEI